MAVRQSKSQGYSSKVEPVTVLADMDPRLQRFMERRRRGLYPPATSSTDRDEIAVLARVRDVERWRAMSEVREGGIIGAARDGKGSIVTARIPLSQLEAVRKAPGVLSLKPAHRLRPSLAATLKDTHADTLPPLTSGGAGRGAIVGIVDYGGDFVHKNLRKAKGSSDGGAVRFRQGGVGRVPGCPGAGARHDRNRDRQGHQGRLRSRWYLPARQDQ